MTPVMNDKLLVNDKLDVSYFWETKEGEKVLE